MKRPALKPKHHYKPVELQRFHDWVADHGCLVCGFEATLHHVSGYADRAGRFSRDHWLVVPLCPRHHQAVFDDASDPQSVERLSHQGFYAKHGKDLRAEAERLAEQWRNNG